MRDSTSSQIPDLRIVDSAVHLWAPQDPADPWPAGYLQAAAIHRGPLSAEELVGLMDAAGVARAVVTPPFFTGYRNRYPIDETLGHPDRFRIMARPYLHHDEPEWHVIELASLPLVAGLRLVMTPRAGATLDDGSSDWLWPLAERRSLPVMMLAPDQHDSIRRIALAHPGLRLALDHLNLNGSYKDHAIAAEIEALVRLADLPNVSVKMSAVPCYSSEPFPYPALQPHLGRVLDAFGPARVFFGSDLSRLPGGYEPLIELFTTALPFLSGEALRLVMGAALETWLNWIP